MTLVFGEAIAANIVADDEDLTGKLLYSRPYYRTGYVLVQPQEWGRTFRHWLSLGGVKSQRLGTEAGSVADLRCAAAVTLRRYTATNSPRSRRLMTRDIDHAYLWANVGPALPTPL